MAADGGEVIGGRYRLISRLGSGAMGVVWKAHDERLRRMVAIKQLKTPIGLSSSQIEVSHNRARREARIAARLQHPHAVALYDVFEHEDRPCLVMEYVASRSLAQVLADDVTLPQADVAAIGAQLASALIAAHEAGIVHRDIKPGNILMSDSGTAKLTDFGISRAIDDVTVTATGEMLGTPAYISPEAAQGRPAGVASDIFSLGATLYSAIEGEPPFGMGPTAMSLLLRIVNGEIRQPVQTGALVDTVMWMLNQDPTERPSLDRVRRDLQSYADEMAADDAASESAVDEVAAESNSEQPAEPDEPAETPESGKLFRSAKPAKPAKAPKAAKTKPTKSAEVVTAEVAEVEAVELAEVEPTTPAEPTKPTKVEFTKPVEPAEPTTVEPKKPAKAEPKRPAKPAKVELAKSADSPADREPSLAAAPIPPVESHPAERKRSKLLPVAFLLVAAVLTTAVVTAITVHSHSPKKTTTATGKTGTTSTTGQAAVTSSATPKSSTSPTQSATSSASASASTSTATTSASIAQQLTDAVNHYYSLMPGNTDAAWNFMTSDYQQNIARGKSNYKAFWNNVQSVALSNLSAQAPSTVTVTLTYHFKDGSTERDRTQFTLVQQNGTWKFETSKNL